MERDPEKKSKKSSKEKRKRRKEEKKAKHKRRRSSRSRSSSSSSSSGGDARAETPAQELARLREACTQLRSLLRSFPDVPRRDVRLLLWNVDAGQGVDLTPLPGALRCADCARQLEKRRLMSCVRGVHRFVLADERLRAALTRLFETLLLKRTPSGLHVSLPGAPPVLRAVGHVFDEPLDEQPAQPVPAPSDPLRRHAAPIGACAAAPPAARAVPPSPNPLPGPAKPPRREHVYSGPAPDVDDRDSDSDGPARAPVVLPGSPPQSPSRAIGPAAPPPAARPVDVPRRVLGPSVPAPEVLAEAALLSEQFAGPPPPELVAEADGASAESREQAVARVLRCLAPPPADRDAYSVLALDPGASAGEVKKAYWRLSLLVHPDKCAHPRAAEAFAALAKARDELADASGRAALDARRAEAALRAEFNAELAGKVQAAQWRRTRGLAPLPGDDELLDGDAEARRGGREEWMTALPPERQVRAGAPPVPTTSVAAFSRVERTGRGDTSEWTDTPAERAARQQRNLLEGPGMHSRPAALMGMGAAEQQAAALVDQYNAAKRPMSLVEAHQARLAAQAKATKKAKRTGEAKGDATAGADAPQSGAPWRPFDRDKDLQAPRGGATTDYMQTLPGRFTGGSSQPRKFL